MFPIRDSLPSRRRPWITYGIIALNVLVYLYELMLGPYLNRFIWSFGFVPARFFAIGDWETVFTSMFMHGGFLHIAGNMLYLWVFGDNVEDVLGRLYYPIFYLATGVAAVFAHALFFPDSRIPLVGASGAISGVLGAYLLFFPRNRITTLVFWGWFFDFIEVPALVYLLFWFVLQMINGALSAVAAGGAGVAYFAHAGGFVAGLILALPVYLVRRSLNLYPFNIRYYYW